MKKLYLSLGVLFVSSVLYADEFRNWRSTEIKGEAIGGVPISTVSVYIHDIQVTSGSVNNATCVLAVSTRSYSTSWAVGRSSFAPMNIGSVLRPPIQLDFSTGRDHAWYVATTGGATILIRYLPLQELSAGHKSDGLKATGNWDD